MVAELNALDMEDEEQGGEEDDSPVSGVSKSASEVVAILQAQRLAGRYNNDDDSDASDFSSDVSSSYLEIKPGGPAKSAASKYLILYFYYLQM